MKHLRKILLLCILLIAGSAISFALTPTPKVDVSNVSAYSGEEVYVSGTVSIGAGQKILLLSGNAPINSATVGNSGKSEAFKIKIPNAYVKDGVSFKVKSQKVKGKVNSSATKNVTVRILPKKNQTITVSDISVNAGESKSLGAKAQSGLKLTYSSSNTGVATVNANGKVTGKSKGTATITIKQAGNAEWNAVSKTVKVTVGKSLKSQTITASNKTIHVGDSVSLKASASSKLKLSYSSSNKNIATVSNGKVTGKKAGKAKITIKQAGNATYKPASKTITVTVKKKTISAIDKYQFARTGLTVKITAKSSGKGKITFKSSNPKVVSIKDGKMTSKKAGSATITISQSGAASKKIKVKVPSIRGRRAALQPWYDAMEAQRKWSWNSRYDWWPNNGPTIATSKTVGTCTTYPSVSAQRCGLIKQGSFIAIQSNGLGTAKKAYKSINSRYWSHFTYSGRTTKSLVNSGKILPGDICESKAHVYVYAGKNKSGKLLYNHAGRRYGMTMNRAKVNDVSANDSENPLLVSRINTFNVYTSCTNGSITQSNQHMAGQTVTIKYSSTKKLKSVTVDGKAVSIKKYPKSYKFKKLDRPHTVSVRFE